MGHGQHTHLGETPWLDPQAAPIVEIKGVTKRFGEVTAVKDVDLAVYAGELFAILGGSGWWA